MAGARRVTAPDIAGSKGGDRLVMVTAYDAPSARVVDEAGVDMILVGDTLAMVVLGYDDTLQVTVADLAHHTAAVARGLASSAPDRGAAKPLVVADLPWLSYHTTPVDTVLNAAQLIRAGAQAVKLEGGRKRLPMVEALVDAETPAGERRDRLVASFNRGYRGFQQTYRTCTPAADVVIRRYLQEGAKISREITARYAN